MNMLCGEYNNTLDEKGRIQFPAKLRSVLQQDGLVVTRGLDRCLMLFTMDEWTSLTEKIMGSASLFDSNKRMVLRRFLSPGQEVAFDKSGRLSIPQSLRDYAGLKGECTILGMNKYMELWDSETYGKYLEETEDSFIQAASESMGDIIL
ncbi:MAG: division/cell wall cluster transcriptional repressor MraZ [Treponema sp.]|nr:division/cell wall cluster transcriptional repressor MraZ [Treponema sp.]